MSKIAKEFFAHAAAEVSAGQLDQALYIKALATSQGDEVKARALYISLRAEELQSNYERAMRHGATEKVIGGAAGFGVVLAKAALAFCSLIVPGSGQLLSRRFRAAGSFFAPWALLGAFSFLNLRFLHWFDYDAPFSSLGWWQAALLILVSLSSWSVAVWAAIDTFRGFRRARPLSRPAKANRQSLEAV